MILDIALGIALGFLLILATPFVLLAAYLSVCLALVLFEIAFKYLSEIEWHDVKQFVFNRDWLLFTMCFGLIALILAVLIAVFD